MFSHVIQINVQRKVCGWLRKGNRTVLVHLVTVQFSVRQSGVCLLRFVQAQKRL